MADVVDGGVAAAADGDGLDVQEDPETVAENEPPKKRRRHYRVDSVLPKKPQKARTAYSMFLKDFFRELRGGVISKTAMKDASVQWRNIAPAKKRFYEEMCADDRTRYNRQMQCWKQQRDFVKRPPSAFALFLKELWETERNNHPTIADMGKLASERWRGMSPDQKAQYRTRYEDLLVEQKARMLSLEEGNVTVDQNGIRMNAPPPPDANVDPVQADPAVQPQDVD